MNLLRLRYKRFHISELLLWLGCGMLVGLSLGHFSGSYDASFLLIGLLLLLGAMRSKRWWALVAIFMVGGIVGLSRGAIYRTDLERYEPLVGRTVTLVANIASDPQDTNKGTTKLTLEDITIDNRKYAGEVFVTTIGKANLKRGDTVTLTGQFRDGFATYPVSMSYAKIQNIQRYHDVIRDIREQFSTALRHHVIEPMASLGLGFVVGQRSTLPDELDEQLKIVGLTHIVVASGYNLTILVRFVMRFFSRHSRYVALMISLLLMAAFVLFSGFSPSMNRAVVVTFLSLLAWYVGRRFHPVFLLVYVAAGTAFLNPMYVWADLGWYLSFFAFTGVLIVSPLVVQFLYRKRQATSIEQLVIETMSAEIMALPIVAVAFGVVPLFGLVANVLVAPVIPFAMAFTALTGVLALLSPVLGAVVALPTTICIAYIIAVVEWLSSIPWAQLTVDIPVILVGIWYAGIGFLCVWLRRKTGYSFRKIYRGNEV